jgi:hypothetical protein
MRYPPKIVDHSELQASIVLNRTKLIMLTDLVLTPEGLIEAYMETTSRALVDLSFSYHDGWRTKLLKIFGTFCDKVNVSGNTTLMAKALGYLFVELNKIQILSCCNYLVNNKFVVEVSSGMQKLGMLPRALDFRIMDAETDWECETEVSQTFLFSLNNAEPLCFDEEDPLYWPEDNVASIEIAGFHYLTFDHNFLVTANGGLIEAESVSVMLERAVKQTDDPLEFKVEKGAVEAYLFGRAQGLSTVDGIAFSPSVPLVCLDVDHLTGLVMDDDFEYLISNLKSQPLSLLEALTTANSLPSSVVQRIKRLKQYINIATTRFFKDKRPARSKPQLFMAVGGAMSDASLNKSVEETVSGDYIHISLHRIRQCSKLYDFYHSCGHHLAGYKALDLFVAVLLEELLIRAQTGGFNCLLDNVSQVLRPGVLANFRDRGYEMHLCSNSSTLFVERDRKDLAKPEILQIAGRIRRKKSIETIAATITSNIEHPTWLLTEICNRKIWDCVKLYDSATAAERTLIGLVTWCNDAQINALREVQNVKGRLFQKLLALPEVENVRLNKHFDLCRLDFVELAHTEHNKRAILVLFDAVKFIDLMQKGMLYRNATSYDELLYNSHTAHLPSLDYPYDKRREESKWRLRNQVLNGSYLL